MKTLLFVDDEPKVLQGLQRQLRPMHNEWDMHFVDDGRKALEFMATRPVDIVVTHMMMPGMDGSQLLAEVLKRHPQTVRIVLSGHAEREAVLRLVGPAHQYLSKPCDADELRKAIARALSLRDLLGNERLKQLATRVKNLPTLPALQNQLAGELRKESPSMERVAVIYLGLNTVRALALSVGIFSQYDEKLCRLFSLDLLARHSWTTGVLARGVAHMERQDAKMLDQCFLAGMLHDVGQLILAAGLHEEYSDVIARAGRQNLTTWQAEQECFGASHAAVGAYLLALWALPNPIIEAVGLHHEPARCATPEFSPAVIVHVADVFAHEFSGINTEVPPPTLDTGHLAKLGLAGRIEAWRAGCQELITT